jgi:hypothetical protein
MTKPEHNDPAPADANEGEGDRTAARRYNRDQQAFVRSGKVEPAARAAQDALAGDEAEALEDAEAAGRARARE